MNKPTDISSRMNNSLATPQGKMPSLLEIRKDSKKYPRIKNINRDDAITKMSMVVTKAMLYRGQTAEKVAINIISSSLVDEILQDDKWGLKNLAMEEISIVIKRAVLESDFYISISTLYRVLVEFCKGEGKQNQAKADAESIPIEKVYDYEWIEKHKQEGRIPTEIASRVRYPDDIYKD